MKKTTIKHTCHTCKQVKPESEGDWTKMDGWMRWICYGCQTEGYGHGV